MEHTQLINLPSLILGIIVGSGVTLNVMGLIYWVTVARMRREDVTFRLEQRRRMDDMQERSERLHEQARRDIGLPPRALS